MMVELPPPRSSRISMTPLIDVVFILLLFFMLTSSLSAFSQIELTSAGAGSTTSVVDADQASRFRVQANGQVEYDGQVYDLLSEALSKTLALLAQQDAAVIVSAHPEASVQDLIDLMDRAYRAGVVQLSVAESSQ
ncbi:ExbD/TolR family protein [Reinekea blandensis]|uniref:Biopolymer transport protein n=1 Tax=Reinekea blandensis MED297 TaxID=314283 RepID=A4BA50_9GAMM|nr:biopolymer transporter ExbD [Reinekea blandensis]EAR10806.1 hypothetical protein MED297_09861 [Reinekea sp. MED297] [Reinekea blandensis MED297]